MAGVCGWIGGAEAASGADRLLRTMAARVEYGRPSAFSARLAKGAAVGACGEEAASGAHAEGALIAAYEGIPVWQDRELADIAGQQGHAVALIRGFQRYGRDLPKKLRGHVAFAVLDGNSRRAVVAIDRLATRTMYFSELPNGLLVFGASAQSLRVHPQLASDLHPQALFDYLYFARIPAPETIYRDQRKLMPAQAIWYDRGRVDIDRYWSMPYADDASFALEQQTEALHAALRRGVDRALEGVDQERVGAFLSGGVDSSTVLGLLCERRSAADAFSIGFAEQGYDEMEYARISARHFAAKHHEYYVTPDDVADAVSKIAAAYDEPYGNASAVAVYYCARLAREKGMSLLLAGDGGDELFGGNARYAKQKVFARYEAIPEWLRHGVLEPLIFGTPLGDSIPPLRKARSYIRQANIPLPFRLEANNPYEGRVLSAIFDNDLAGAMNAGHPRAVAEEVYGRTSSQAIVHRMLHMDLQLILADDDLRKVSRMCELAGIGVRFPLLDDDLAELSAGVPAEMLVKGFKLRYFFKRAMHGFLPEATLTKSKHGFGLPYGQWLLSGKRLRALAHDAFASLKDRHIFQPSFLDDTLRRHESGHVAYHGAAVWDLMMLALWLDAHSASHAAAGERSGRWTGDLRSTA